MKLSLGAMMFFAGVNMATTTTGIMFMFVCFVFAFLGGVLVDSSLNDKVRK